MASKGNPELTRRAQALRKNMTNEERKLWYRFLKNLPIPVHRQKVIGNKIADFYCAKAKLVIELDGSQHYEAEHWTADRIRDDDFARMQLLVLRYSNAEINGNFKSACEDILRHIQERSQQRLF